MATFQDSFTGDKGDAPSSIWTPYPWAPTGATAQSGRVQLDGRGHLELTIDNAQQSAAIWTKDRLHIAPPFSMMARAKFPAAMEIWHSWWWVNSTGGEIDVYENGGLKQRVQSSTHQWVHGDDVSDQVTKCPINFDPQAVYHVYEARVYPERVLFFVDGIQTAKHVVDPKAFSAAGWFVLNLWPAPGAATGGFPATLRVEKVRVVSL